MERIPKTYIYEFLAKKLDLISILSVTQMAI